MMAERVEGPVHDGYRHRLPATVRFCDLDLRGHLNNVALLQLMETARVEYFATIGLGPPTAYECVVASLTVDYLSPAGYGDDLLGGVRVDAVGRTSLTLSQRVWRRADGVVIADAKVTLVAREGEPKRPSPVPQSWRDRIAAWEPHAVAGI